MLNTPLLLVEYSSDQGIYTYMYMYMYGLPVFSLRRELCKRLQFEELCAGLKAMTSPTRELLSMYEVRACYLL